MDSFTGLFSNLSETLTTNFMPIAVVLVLVLLVAGWLVYKSFTGSKVESEPQPEQSEPEPEQKQEVDETPDTEGFEQESEN
jgi:flagellar basal body-associated protein FliL